jgi:hypothetical protein
LSGVWIFAIVALFANWFVPGVREMWTDLNEKWLEIAESFDFRLTRHWNLDNLGKFAQKRHSLPSGSRKPKLNSSGILSLAPGGKK